jgi:uncharacterized protein YwgA
MNLGDIVLIVIKRASEKADIGRTVIQKAVYFAQKKGVVEVKFLAHYYGPYSRILDNEINNLVGAGLVNEELSPRSGGGIVYHYSLSNDVKQYVEKRFSNTDEYNILRDLINDLHRSCKLNYEQMSYAAKIDYLLNESDRSVMTKDELQRSAKEKGWNIDDSSFSSGVPILIGLGFIRSG